MLITLYMKLPYCPKWLDKLIMMNYVKKHYPDFYNELKEVKGC